ncbi:hypothetical protein ACQJBY_015977 [Aegilops geniculata]
MRGDDEMMSAMTNELLCHGFRRGTVGKPWRRLGPAMELVLGTPHRAPSRCSSLLAAPPHLQNKEAQVLANRENSFTEAPTTPKFDGELLCGDVSSSFDGVEIMMTWNTIMGSSYSSLPIFIGLGSIGR